MQAGPDASEEGKLKGDLTIFNWEMGHGGLWDLTIYELGICDGLMTTLLTEYQYSTLAKTGLVFPYRAKI